MATETVMSSDKVREDRLRRQLDRMGYRLMKSRARDPRDITTAAFRSSIVRLAELTPGRAIFNRGYAFSLGDVETWVNER
jgi:hypothetical protein